MKKRLGFVLQTSLMLFWSSCLRVSDSYYTPYLVIGIGAFVCLYIDLKETEVSLKEKDSLWIKVSALLFSLIVAAANYSMIPNSVMNIDIPPDYLGLIRIYEFLLLIFLVIGGFFVAWNILYCLSKRLKDFYFETKSHKISPMIVFCIPFIVISLLNITLLFICMYPGTLTPDSISQVTQVMSGEYSNHHPFYHTIVIKLFVTIGLKIFGDINAAIATYHVFQIIFMAMCFSMVILTLYEMNISLKIIILTALWYIFMPFHIMYSFTMWKDVMFGGFVVLFVVYTYRVLKNLGQNKTWNYVMLSISGLGICLFRSNGLFVFIVTFCAFLLFFRKTERFLCLLFIGIIVMSFVMKHPLLDHLCGGIDQPDIIESLSIPAQQIARTIVDHNDLTDDQKKLLSRIIEIKEIPQMYKPYISDPIKVLVRNKNNQKYIVDNKFLFIRAYIQIGFKHPLSYIKAWIDETRGFWNAGYSYGYFSDYITENEYGIVHIIRLGALNKCLNAYAQLFRFNSLLQLFTSIGFYVWIDCFLCFMSVVRKDKIGLFMTIPVLAVIASLIISTPVFAEFRYAYAVFCSLPFIIFVVFCRNEREETHG